MWHAVINYQFEKNLLAQQATAVLISEGPAYICTLQKSASKTFAKFLKFFPKF